MPFGGEGNCTLTPENNVHSKMHIIFQFGLTFITSVKTN